MPRHRINNGSGFAGLTPLVDKNGRRDITIRSHVAPLVPAPALPGGLQHPFRGRHHLPPRAKIQPPEERHGLAGSSRRSTSEARVVAAQPQQVRVYPEYDTLIAPANLIRQRPLLQCPHWA